MITFNVQTRERAHLIDITPQVQAAVTELAVRSGRVTVFIPHTTAGVTINENADPDVVTDILAGLEAMAPTNGRYRHAEGNSAAHIKASLMGASAHLLVENGQLRLGTWQSIYFCEFDGPRQRQVWVG